MKPVLWLKNNELLKIKWNLLDLYRQKFSKGLKLYTYILNINIYTYIIIYSNN